jgi:hypothetical protein
MREGWKEKGDLWRENDIDIDFVYGNGDSVHIGKRRRMTERFSDGSPMRIQNNHRE